MFVIIVRVFFRNLINSICFLGATAGLGQQQQFQLLLNSLNQCCQLIWHQQCELSSLRESFLNVSIFTQIFYLEIALQLNYSIIKLGSLTTQIAEILKFQLFYFFTF